MKLNKGIGYSAGQNLLKEGIQALRGDTGGNRGYKVLESQVTQNMIRGLRYRTEIDKRYNDVRNERICSNFAKFCFHEHFYVSKNVRCNKSLLTNILQFAKHPVKNCANANLCQFLKNQVCTTTACTKRRANKCSFLSYHSSIMVTIFALIFCCCTKTKFLRKFPKEFQDLLSIKIQRDF